MIWSLAAIYVSRARHRMTRLCVAIYPPSVPPEGGRKNKPLKPRASAGFPNVGAGYVFVEVYSPAGFGWDL